MHVWIDQDLCTGDGLCMDHCSEAFVLLEDGISYVREGGQPLNDPGGSRSLAWVPARLVTDVIHAAEVCPGECIFIEIDHVSDVEPDKTFEPRMAKRVGLAADL